jgi:cell division protease FtsH
MVTEWGMSDALGAVHYDGNKRNRFLDIPLGPERGSYAEDTARLIDGEVKRIMGDAHEQARRILSDKRDLLEQITRRLLDIEVMEGDELRRMLGAPAPPPHAERDTTPIVPPTNIH